MFVYIIQSSSNKSYYIGSSLNPKKRLTQHNSGKTYSTSNKGPWILVFFQEFQDKSTALKIERKLKSFKSKKIIEKIIDDGFVKSKV